MLQEVNRELNTISSKVPHLPVMQLVLARQGAGRKDPRASAEHRMMRRPIAPAKRLGIIFILSAPSGAGKTTLYNGLREIYPEIELSVSCTTRAKRAGEVNGRDYHLSHGTGVRAFEGSAASLPNGPGCTIIFTALLKHRSSTASLQDAIYCSTSMSRARAKSRKAYPQAVSIFLLPPSLSELKRRLAARGTDGKEIIRRRLANAQGEIGEIIHYDYYVVNREVDRGGTGSWPPIVEAERARISRVTEWRIEPLRGKAASTERWAKDGKNQRSGRKSPARIIPPRTSVFIRTAYEFSAKVHQGQKRLSGEPYLIHPLAVAEHHRRPQARRAEHRRRPVARYRGGHLDDAG